MWMWTNDDRMIACCNDRTRQVFLCLQEVVTRSIKGKVFLKCTSSACKEIAYLTPSVTNVEEEIRMKTLYIVSENQAIDNRYADFVEIKRFLSRRKYRPRPLRSRLVRLRPGLLRQRPGILPRPLLITTGTRRSMSLMP